VFEVKRETCRGVLMTLELKNIGMIKEASVKIDGLTVIAGENDTGKSTVGKALFLIYSSMSLEAVSNIELFGTEDIHNLGRKNIHGEQIKKNIFSKQSFNSSSLMRIVHDKNFFEYSDEFIHDTLYKKDIKIANIAFIETPIVWNLQKLFRNQTDIESQFKLLSGESLDIPYPFLMKDLYFKLGNGRKYTENWTKKYQKDIASIINGEFKKDEDGIFRFYRENKKIDLIDVATGIKYFGILQTLLNANRLNSYTLLILDEPEVHLHPKWQLEMAKIIVELVKNSVKVVVNSHSPYMIEALKRYSEVAEIEEKTNFYLAENGYIKQIENSNSLTLEQIFEKLSEPFDVFDKMDSERLQNG